MRIKRESKIMFATLAGIIAVCTMIAAVPGIFSFVDSTNGYKVNGTAASSGTGLCSDGTYYNTPCAAGASPKYQTMQSNGADQTQENRLNFSTDFVLSDSAGTSTNVALAGASSLANPGYAKFPNGLIFEWKTGTLQSDSGVTQTITFPLACPTGLFQVTPGSITTFDDTSMPTFVVTSQSSSSVTLGMQRVPDHGFEPATPTIFVVCH